MKMGKCTSAKLYFICTLVYFHICTLSYGWYLNTTTAFFCSVEVILTSHRCLPAFTTISEVLGGISPRFSATITSS